MRPAKSSSLYSGTCACAWAVSPEADVPARRSSHAGAGAATGAAAGAATGTSKVDRNARMLKKAPARTERKNMWHHAKTQ